MDLIGWIIGTVGAVAAVGAWLAAWYPSRFRPSWIIEPMANPTQFLVRNNTNCRADLLEVSATPLFPDKPTEPPTFELEAPSSATLEPGEAFGVRTSRSRGVVIIWNRRRWWGRSTQYNRELTLPIKYA